MSEQDIEELAALVQRSQRTVVFTGAGMSTECGIPDFRSPGGFWTKHQPIPFQDFIASDVIRREAWRRFFAISDTIAKAAPGPGHKALARLVALGHVSHVITQNIDGMHANAGVPPQRIIEIHGNATYAACLSCGQRHELEWARETLERQDLVPACTACGGIVKSATIAFGQSMPERAMADASAATLDADLFLAIGSSLKVFPAAGLPVLATRNRTPLVIVNREPTGLDGLARMVINAEIATVLPRLVPGA